MHRNKGRSLERVAALALVAVLLLGSLPLIAAPAKADITAADVADALVEEYYSATNFGASSGLQAGRYTDWWHIGESFIKFDLTPLAGQPGTIYLNLYLNGLLSSGGLYKLARCTSSWGEMTVTYGTRPTYDNSSSDPTFTVDTDSTWYQVDVTSLVHAMLSGDNYGFILRSVNEAGGPGAVNFDSREGTNKPFLSLSAPSTWAPTFISSPPSTTAKVGYYYNVTLTCNESVMFTRLNYPNNTLTPLPYNDENHTVIKLSWEPQVWQANGSYDWNLEATSENGTLSAYLNWTVNVSAQWGPIFLSVPSLNCVRGHLYNYTAVTNESCLIYCTIKPSWANFSESNATIWGRPLVDMNYTVFLEAESINGTLRTDQQFVVNVHSWGPAFTSLPPLYTGNNIQLPFYYLGYSVPSIETVIAPGSSYTYAPRCNESASFTLNVTAAPGVDTNNTWQNYPNVACFSWDGSTVNGSDVQMNQDPYGMRFVDENGYASFWSPGLWFFYLKATNQNGTSWQNWTLKVIYWSVSLVGWSVPNNVTVGHPFTASFRVADEEPWPHGPGEDGYFPTPVDRPRYFFDILENLTVADLWYSASVIGANGSWLHWSLDNSSWSPWTENASTWDSSHGYPGLGYWQFNITGTPTEIGNWTVSFWLHSIAGGLYWNNIPAPVLANVTYPHPIILTLPPLMGMVAVLYSYVALADQSNVTWTLAGTAWWLHVISATGECDGIPDSAGVENVTLTVTNQYNLSDSQTWTLFVQLNPNMGNGNGNGDNNGSGSQTIIILSTDTELMYIAIFAIVAVLIAALVIGRRR